MPSIPEADTCDVPLRCVMARSRRSCHSYGSRSTGSIQQFTTTQMSSKSREMAIFCRPSPQDVNDEPSGEDMDILDPGVAFLRPAPPEPFLPLLEEEVADGSWASALALGPNGPPSTRAITEFANSSPAVRSAMREWARGSEDMIRTPRIASS